MKICLTTLYDKNFQNFMPYVSKSFEKFCDVNSFDIEIYNNMFDSSLHPSWNKLLAIKECFKKYDLVFWCDADSLFTGINENFLKMNNFNHQSNFMIASDENGICSSHILVKNTEYNLKLIDTLLFLSDVKNNDLFGIGPKWEQNTLKVLIQHFNIKFQVMNKRSMKWTTPEMFHDDIFFFHYAVQSNDVRYEAIKNHFGKLYLNK
jgi:hypothetical protein